MVEARNLVLQRVRRGNVELLVDELDYGFEILVQVGSVALSQLPILDAVRARTYWLNEVMTASRISNA